MGQCPAFNTVRLWNIGSGQKDMELLKNLSIDDVRKYTKAILNVVAGSQTEILRLLSAHWDALTII